MRFYAKTLSQNVAFVASLRETFPTSPLDAILRGNPSQNVAFVAPLRETFPTSPLDAILRGNPSQYVAFVAPARETFPTSPFFPTSPLDAILRENPKPKRCVRCAGARDLSPASCRGEKPLPLRLWREPSALNFSPFSVSLG
jgi:hypothetical protein